MDTFVFRENGFQESVSTFGTVAGFWSSAYSLGYLQQLLMLYNVRSQQFLKWMQN